MEYPHVSPEAHDAFQSYVRCCKMNGCSQKRALRELKLQKIEKHGVPFTPEQINVTKVLLAYYFSVIEGNAPIA